MQSSGFPEKLGAKSQGRRGERKAASWKKVLPASPIHANGRQGKCSRAPESSHPFSVAVMRVKGQERRGGGGLRQLAELRFSVRNRTYPQSPGFGLRAFATWTLDHRDPEVAMRAPAGGAAQPLCLLLHLSRK